MNSDKADVVQKTGDLLLLYHKTMRVQLGYFGLAQKLDVKPNSKFLLFFLTCKSKNKIPVSLNSQNNKVSTLGVVAL